MKTKRYLVKDELGENYEVTELDEQTVDEEETVVSETELTEDEKSALKRLAAVADKLIALIPVETEPETEVEEEFGDEEIDETEEKEEEVIDTCKSKDSRKSFGAIEKKRHANDSFDTSIDDAWAKRYGGNK